MIKENESNLSESLVKGKSLVNQNFRKEMYLQDINSRDIQDSNTSSGKSLSELVSIFKSRHKDDTVHLL